MDVYKYFIVGIRNVSLKDVYIIITQAINVSPRLLNYVKFLTELKYEDGKYHTYFGNIKRLVDSFVTFWTENMDEALKEGDRLSHVTEKKILLSLIENTIDTRNYCDRIFDDLFLPIETDEQREIYDDTQKRFEKHMNGLYEMKNKLEKMDKQEQVDEFAKSEFARSIAFRNEMFLYAHTYISMLLADHLAEIRGSIKEILQRLRKNRQILQEEAERDLNILLNQLYDKNKQHLMLSRREDGVLKETAEIERSIETMRRRVTEYGSHSKTIENLQEEECYFDMKLKEFEPIASTLLKAKAELENVEREEAVYVSMCAAKLPSLQYYCWQNMEETYAKHKDCVKKNLFEAAKALLTFFSVRGPSHMRYTDTIGPYHIDEHGHQVYCFESGLRMHHVDCERNYKEVVDEDKYYYDDKGRYIYQNGEKVYQVQACTSSYQLGEDRLLKKITKDCGHSEVGNKDCGMRIKDLTHVEWLPRTEPVDITRTLDSEVVRYLWDSVGAVLPHALYDVGMLRPRNPIHFLAHRLLVHKYGKTTAELRQKKQEADEFRAKVLRERKEKAVAESKAWKAKQVKRRKPEESDDTQERAAYDKYVATNALIESLHFYYD